MLDRTCNLGVSTLRFLKELPENYIYNVPKRQLARSITSVAANYEEAQGAHSKKDFLYKISICFKEARESHYWMRTLKELYSVEEFDFALQLKEIEEVKNIFAQIRITAEKNLKKT